MTTKQEEGAINVEKLNQYVVRVKNGDCSIPMRNGDVYVKGVCEIILGRKLPRAPTWINTRDDAASLMEALRILSGKSKHVGEVHVTTSELDELRKKVSELEKKLALKEMQFRSILKENQQLKNADDHTRSTGRLTTERLEFFLTK